MELIWKYLKKNERCKIERVADLSMGRRTNMAVKLRAWPPARASMIDQLRERSTFKKWRYSTRRLEMSE